MADSQQSATLLTKLLLVSDHTMAMHQWMLFAAALRRRPEYRCLLADPLSQTGDSRPKSTGGGV